MGRPIFPYEMGDPDFSWLLTTYQENNPEFVAVEDPCLPVILVRMDDPEYVVAPTETDAGMWRGHREE